MTSSLSKTDLRLQARGHRDRLCRSDADHEAAAALFREAVTLTPQTVVAAYWPAGSEFDCRYIIDDILKSGATLALPVCDKGRPVMQFRRWDGAEPLEKGTYGIMVPPAGAANVIPDILLIPLLAFDRAGHRLGQGAGHYDATLAALRHEKEVTAIGLAYAEQAVLFALPAEAHDQKLDLVITAKEVYSF